MQSNGHAGTSACAIPATSHVERSEPRVRNARGFWRGLYDVITASRLNVLIVFIPIAWAFRVAKPDSHSLIFSFAFLAILPLKQLVDSTADQISMRFNAAGSSLLKASLTNAVELTILIIALLKCQLQVVQFSFVGSLLCKSLLALGPCLVVGGICNSEQSVNKDITANARTDCYVLYLSVIASLLPVGWDKFTAGSTDEAEIQLISHVIAVVLLFNYIVYIIYCLRSRPSPPKDQGVHGINRGDSTHILLIVRNANPTTQINDVEAGLGPKDATEENQPRMSMLLGFVPLVFFEVLLIFTAMFLVDSIDGFTETSVFNKQFVGLIILPIVSNFADITIIANLGRKNKMTDSMGLAMGSSIQFMFFVIPLIVILAWIIGKPLTLLLDPYQVLAWFSAVTAIKHFVDIRKSNWLEGIVVISLYLMVAVALSRYEPQNNPSFATCG